MEDKELSLKINVASIADHLNCPICMCMLSNTNVTFCGHRFCEQCIAECINRRRKCPCCNADLTQTMVIKDHQFDNLIETIKKEESVAEKQYFDNLIHMASKSLINNEGSEPGGNSEFRQMFTPIEEVLKEHLKKGLVLHEKFYQDLKKDVLRQHSLIDASLQRSLEQLHSSESTKEADTLLQEAEAQKLHLSKEMERCSVLVSQAYDRYLTEHIPDLSILPVTVTVSLLNKGLKLCDIHLKPQDSIEDIKKAITEYLKKQGESVVLFGDDVKFICFGPFVKKSLYEMMSMAKDIVEQNAAVQDVSILPSVCRPVIQFSVRPGSEIAVYGQVKFESDLPKVCFSTAFNADDKKPMDYFTCKTCKLNWICRPCMEICHKDHDAVPYILNHQPTWACCYCQKKKNCQIIRANTSM